MADDFSAAQERLHRLEQSVPEEQWIQRPNPARWSVAECVAHLNLTGIAFLPLLRTALDQTRGDHDARRRYRRDPVGWLLWLSSGPPVRFRVQTTAPFIPAAAGAKGALVAEFDRLQAQQIECVRSADGLPLDRVRVISPFNPRLRYNVYSCFTILPRHQHRHLWQAERLLKAR